MINIAFYFKSGYVGTIYDLSKSLYNEKIKISPQKLI